MDQMRHIGDRDKGNTGPIKGTSSLSGTGLSLLLTSFVFALTLFLVVMFTTGLGQEFVDFARGHFHGDLGGRGAVWGSRFGVRGSGFGSTDVWGYVFVAGIGEIGQGSKSQADQFVIDGIELAQCRDMYGATEKG